MSQPRPLFPLLLALALTAVALWSGIGPADRAVWWAEVIPVFAVFGALALGYRHFRFSHLAYALMSLWLFMHLVGAHYTFANVPFDWGNRLLAPLLGEGRNHYDRLAHYIIGFYSFPMAEWLLRRRLCGLALACFFALFFIMSVAAAYEIIEWLYAVIEGGNAGIEFLGSQGDVWDAQKDMLADTLGALTALALFLLARPDRRYGPAATPSSIR
ncbi:MAG: DUF2238 domain-containing protein [Comamonadaceae bacterium]|nr:DUF2238 domain-containing protein [Comamonadaceae bacterium]RRD58791.1 DUF2238 domain-containing protein [Comamonadaceae bacterium OH2545_COT-014]